MNVSMVLLQKILITTNIVFEWMENDE